jgi:putative ABC transport system permease protein
VNSLLEDIRYACRGLRHNPAFAAVAVLSLALGIGANTAIFSLIDAVLLRSLPVPEPQRLVFLSDRESSGVSIGTQTGVRSLFTYEEFEFLRSSVRPLAALCAAESSPARLSARLDRGAVEEVRGKLVTHDYFSVMGVGPILGRTFTPAEDSGAGTGPVAVLSYEFWQSRFNRDVSVVGRTLELNRQTFTVVGVLPQGFTGEVVGDAPAVFVPMSMEPQLKRGRFWLRDDPARAEKVMWLHVVGRLSPGTTIAALQAKVTVAFHQYLGDQAGTVSDANRRKEVMDQQILVTSGASGASTLRDRFTEPLVVLMSMVGLVLLIACANVANLLLARATARQKEIGLRLALGANRFRLVRQFLTESVVLSMLGGALGLVVAYWSAQLLVRLASAGPTPIPLNVRPDGRLLAFTAALAVLTGLVFGIVPALRATRVSLNATLKDSAATVSSSGSRLSLGKALVVGQVALSVLLLVGAGLFARTLGNLSAADLGYSRDHLLIVRVEPVSAGYAGGARAAVYRQLLESFRSIPGTKAVTLSENGLFSGTESADRVTVEGYHSDKDEDNSARFDQVGPDYFGSIGIPMILGRGITARDSEAAPRVCVVNEAFATFYFGKENPIGRHVRDEFPDTQATFVIVGVARNARDHAVKGDVPRRFYVPFFQSLGEIPGSAYYEIRTSADPETQLPLVRRKVRDVNEALPITSATALSALVDRSITRERMIARVSTFFGALALLLASVGLYGVLSYATARRTREIGIRMALGAPGGLIRTGVLRETMTLVALGLAIGVPAALASSRLVRTALFGLEPTDPGTIAGAVIVVVAVALAAAYFPARRASRVDPLTALRCE